MTNRIPAVCGHCGSELAPHRGRVWRDHDWVWRCTCLDASACKARLQPKRTTRQELSWAVRMAIQAGALETPIDVLAARASGEKERPRVPRRRRRSEAVLVPVQIALDLDCD